MKSAVPHEECIWGAHLPYLGLSPKMDKPMKSVTHGQCDARPTVIFPTAGIAALRLVPNYAA